MNSNDHKLTESERGEDLCVEWRPILRTVYTKDDIAAMVAVIDSTTAVSQSPER
jgi:hypothetical protein